MAIDADPEPENQNIARWMANGYTLVFRPQWSGGGEGVFFLSRDDEAWRINGHSATRAAGPQHGGGIGLARGTGRKRIPPGWG